MTLHLTRLSSASALRCACFIGAWSVAAGAAWAAGADPLTGNALLDDPIATTRVPDGTTIITQTREQNAVTSVQVRRGTNVYHVTPPEQIPSSEQGGRAATWEIFQFRPSRARNDRAEPPPSAR